MAADPTPSEDFPDPPLLATLRRLEDEGFGGQFRSADDRADGTVQCLTCRQTFPASAIAADLVVRLEGASDPDDMVAVVAVICPHCGAKGPLVLGYGPNAQPEDAAVLGHLERHSPIPPAAY